MRKEMIEANEFQKRLRQQRELELQREEQEFREQMMAKFAADHKLEQLNAQKRRIEMANYRREVEQLIAERRRQREAAIQAEIEAAAAAAEEEKKRLAIVEAERQRLLREHAPALAQFLPKGVLQSADDYRLVFGKEPTPTQTFGIKKREQLQSFDNVFR